MLRTATLLGTALALGAWGVVTGTRTPLPLPEAGATYEALVLDPWRTPLRPRGPEVRWRVASRRGGQVVLEQVGAPLNRRAVAWVEVLEGTLVEAGAASSGPPSSDG